MELKINKCNRCGHEWVQRKTDGVPLRCPKCVSPYWNKPRVRPTVAIKDKLV